MRRPHVSRLTRATGAAALAGIAIVCAGCSVSKADLQRDSDDFVPPGGYARAFSTETQEGEVDNRLVGYLTLWSPGTKRQRFAAYERAAREHGWNCDRYGECHKSGITARFMLGVTFAQGTDPDYDRVELDGQWYGVLP
jgi:hypothetical protein